jgi:hypothetical protein
MNYRIFGGNMRKELEPNMETAKKLYRQIKELIEKYTEYCDENGDEENIEYKNWKINYMKLPEKIFHNIIYGNIGKRKGLNHWLSKLLYPNQML